MGTKNLKLTTSKKDGWTCPICNKVFRVRRELEMHKKEIHGSIQHVNLKYEQTCPFCKKTWITTRTGYIKHTNSCEYNPNRIKGDAYKRYHSEETKKKISESRKKYLEEHPDKIPYVMNHSSKASYPEKYFMEVFKNLPVKYNYQVGLYQLDFAIPEKMVYIEIDGEQHFCDKRIVEHDKERTEKLKSLGWTCLRRVRWSDYKKLDNEQQKQYCNELVQLLSK
jgi:very-short-patch-repair endonuclease/uncharacterized C2H2 Zn-finger protein